MSYRIPKHLDNPMRCMGLPIDAVLVAGMVWSGFMLFDKSIYGLVIGPVTAYFYSKYRTRSMVRRMIRFIYWYLPWEMNFIKGVKGHHRQMRVNRCKIGI
jgi:type IV conjugative transfer system protein TraL